MRCLVVPGFIYTGRFAAVCKEAKGIHADERIIRADRRSQEAKHGYKIVRRGKTLREVRSGVHGRHLTNKAATAEVNRAFHRKGGKA